MPRGGKREGAGRPAQGITRKVSLTLSEEEWAEIESSGLTVAAYLKQMMQAPAAAEVDYPRRYAEERWDIYLRNADEPFPPEAVATAKEAMFRNLFPGGAENARVRTKTQYECPFTGKRFGSMESLVKAAIPQMITAELNKVT